MDINITITHKLPDELVRALAACLNTAVHLAEQQANPIVTSDEAPTPKARARKAAAPAEAAPAPAPTFAPPPPATQPSPVPIAAVKAAPAAPAPAKGPSVDELAVLVKQTLARIGTPGTRAVFNQFGVGRLLDLKPEQATAFAAALQAAEAMVATS